MNDAKYIGQDVHQTTISAAVLDSAGQPGDGSDSRNQNRDDFAVSAGHTRQFARDFRRRHVGCLPGCTIR